ncbi:MAG: hypothetical protein ACYC0V_14685 [Armatimonadota bacterium]
MSPWLKVTLSVEDALAFIRERIIPELQKSDGMKMQSHLDGGKGSMF